jgi:hypothetical protein
MVLGIHNFAYEMQKRKKEKERKKKKRMLHVNVIKIFVNKCEKTQSPFATLFLLFGSFKYIFSSIK